MRDYWVPELEHHAAAVPRLLVGTKADLRQDPATKERLAAAGARPVSAQQGARLARQIRAEKYLETSAARDKAGLAAVFEEAVLAVLRPSSARSRRAECRLL